MPFCPPQHAKHAEAGERCLSLPPPPKPENTIVKPNNNTCHRPRIFASRAATFPVQRQRLPAIATAGHGDVSKSVPGSPGPHGWVPPWVTLPELTPSRGMLTLSPLGGGGELASN